ncbi:MAG: hypothetical protein GX100_13555 [candidate division WS1 bacterium]|jgi:hypothetical protein|nr:hypothetical protein [candidate division WS1 bacterium]
MRSSLSLALVLLELCAVMGIVMDTQTPLAAAENPGPLMREAIWSDPQAETVFTERFETEEAPALTPLAGTPQLHFSGVRQGGGYDGGDCYEVDFELPGKTAQQFALHMPETDPRGLYYRLHLKIETDPSPPAGEPFPLRLEFNRAHPPVHTLFYSEPLEETVVKTGEWLEKTTAQVWRAHAEHIFRGWVRYEGDTSGFFRGRYDGRKGWEPFSRIVWIHLRNTGETPLRVRLSLDDVLVIRRDLHNSPEMQALLNTPRPVCQHTRDQILLARKRVAEGATLPSQVAADLKLADQWVEKEITVPRVQAGWPGAFYCKEEGCGGRLVPAPPTGFKCSKCGKMYTGEQWDRLLAYEQHMANSHATRALGFAWQWTDDPRYAKKAEQILLAYAEVISSFPLGHNWLGDCWLMEDFLFGYDYIYESLSEESRQTINEKFVMFEVGRIYHYNHHYPEGYVRLMRVSTWSALLAKDEDWLTFLVLSPTGNREVTFRYGLTDDFVSLKGAAYHGDLVRGFNALGVTLENCGVTFFDERARQLYDAVPRQIFPDRSLPAFGHSNVGYGAGAYGIEVAYRYYRDPVYLALTPESWRQDPGARLFWEEPELPPVEPLKLPSSHMQALGVTLLRTENDTALALSWGAPQRNDPSRLDFQYYGAGGHLLWSSGICGYANPYFEKWYQKSLSRNGLVVDQGTQQAQAGHVLYLDTKSPHQTIVTELVQAFPDTRWLRAVVLFSEGEALILDRLIAPEDRTVDWVCQLPGQVETTVEMAEIESPFGGQNGYEVLEQIRTCEASRPFSIVLRHKDRGVRLVPAPQPDTRLYLAQGRTGTSAVASPVCLLRREGVSTTVYATLLQPFTEAPPTTGRLRITQTDGEVCRVELVTPHGTRLVELVDSGGLQPAAEGATRLTVRE